MAARLRLLYAMTVAVLLVAAATAAILSSGFRRRLRWALGLTAVILFVAFQWPWLTEAGDVVAAAVRLGFLRDAIPVLIAIGFLWLATRRAGEWRFLVGITVPLAAATIVFGAGIAGRVVGPESATGVSPTAAPDAPDVVVLILDAYPGADVLARDFDFDNSDFLRGLENRGFETINSATANYTYTYASLASIFDLDYIMTEGTVEPGDVEAVRQALAGNADLFRYFHQAGYDVAYAENFWDGSHCGPAVDLCWRDGRAEHALWNLSRMTILAPFVDRYRPHPFNSVAVSHLQALPDIVAAARTPGTPRLTVAHIVLPHQPYLLDADCTQVRAQTRPASVWDSDYVAQVQCTNSMILGAMDEIITARPDTLIMIASDHGSDAFHVPEGIGAGYDQNVARRMSILSAYRMPNCSSQLYDGLTPVNGIRKITDCAIGTDLGTVSDLSFWVPPSEKPGTVKEVTKQMNLSG